MPPSGFEAVAAPDVLGPAAEVLVAAVVVAVAAVEAVGFAPLVEVELMAEAVELQAEVA